MDEKPSISGVKKPKNSNPKYYNESYGHYDREKIIWDNLVTQNFRSIFLKFLF